MYEFKSRVRYSECDRFGRLSISGVINYLQDTATLHSEDKNVGLSYLKEHDEGWVVTNYTMNINDFPKMGEEITVRTYPHDMKSCVAYRSFEMLDGRGKRFAAVNSTWTLMNIRELKPVKVSEEMLKAYDPLICPDFTPVSVKLKPEGTEEKVGAFKVTEAEIDTNGHMNNGAYARIADKFLPEDHKISSCAFQYKKMLFLDDEAQVFRAEKADGGLQIIFRKDGEICFMAEFGRTGICVLKK